MKRSLTFERMMVLGTESVNISPEISTGTSLDSHICHTAVVTVSFNELDVLVQSVSISSTEIPLQLLFPTG